jgi:VWFA-related protein
MAPGTRRHDSFGKLNTSRGRSFALLGFSMLRPSRDRFALVLPLALLSAIGILAAQDAGRMADRGNGQRPVFRTGVDLVHVTVTVTDGRGHFVSGLGKDDFTVTEDGVTQPIVQFSADRAPVSIGFALDTSSSMAGTRIRDAKAALFRVVDDLLQGDDEVFLFTFGDAPVLRQAWTTDRRLLRGALEEATADGRTALYDTVDEAVRLLETGRYRKRVLLVVSDGNDTSSFTPLVRLRSLISESEAMIYAIAIDSGERRLFDSGRPPAPFTLPQAAPTALPQISPPRRPPLFPPRPPGKPGPDPGPRPPWGTPPPAPPRARPPGIPSDAANVQALRELTDISGGRTEVVRTSGDLGRATAGVADELSRQYQLMYQATTRRDGRWHAIAVTVRDASYQVRARKGYLANDSGTLGSQAPK